MVHEREALQALQADVSTHENFLNSRTGLHHNAVNILDIIEAQRTQQGLDAVLFVPVLDRSSGTLNTGNGISVMERELPTLMNMAIMVDDRHAMVAVISPGGLLHESYYIGNGHYGGNNVRVSQGDTRQWFTVWRWDGVALTQASGFRAPRVGMY